MSRGETYLQSWLTPVPPLVLLVDDDGDIRELLASYLTREGWQVAQAADTREAESVLQLLVPDVMVLDIMMPGESGIAFAERLRGKGSHLPMLLLSAKGEAEDRIAGLEAGASDYLAKPFDPRELMLRLRNLAGVVPQPVLPSGQQEAVVFGQYRFLLPSGPLLHGADAVHLTEMEQRLLGLLAARAGQAVQRADLQEILGGAERQVDVLVTRLRRKIEPAAGQLHALETVRGQGYRLRAESATVQVAGR
jgi:two-component system phosphate regulon response regulator OmpR